MVIMKSNSQDNSLIREHASKRRSFAETLFNPICKHFDGILHARLNLLLTLIGKKQYSKQNLYVFTIYIK